MLAQIYIENFKSFAQKIELSMKPSHRIPTEKNCVKIGRTNILKNAAIYGENASGKSNLIRALAFMQTVLRDGLPADCGNDFCRDQEENKDRESVFALQFTVDETVYGYGFSAILSQKKIVREWIHEIRPNGRSVQLLTRNGSELPVLGRTINLSGPDKIRFRVYAEDFSQSAANETELFLTEMNKRKEYEKESGLLFFNRIFHWLTQNIVIIDPDIRVSNTAACYNSNKALSSIGELIQSFDTGVTEIKNRKVSMTELKGMLPEETIKNIFNDLTRQIELTGLPNIQRTWRMNDRFFNVRIKENFDPEITTIVLKHGDAEFDFVEESAGTKRMFDLIDMLLTDRKDIVLVADELDRSLHPNLVKHFFTLFKKAHEGTKTQLIFTTLRDDVVNFPLFRRDELWRMDNANKLLTLA